MDKTGIVKSWCDFAKDDLITAKYLLGLHPLKLEIICYHCQQSAEKIGTRHVLLDYKTDFVS
ncbi:MAG: HEPN domain-containing protein [Desulfitobacteriaceae bacterium]